MAFSCRPSVTRMLSSLGGVRRDLDRHGRDLLLAAIAAGEHLQRHRPAGARPDVVEPHALDAGGARRLGGRDRDVERLERHRLDVVRQHHRQRTGDRGRGAEQRALAGEDVLEREIAVALELARGS